MKLCRPFTRHLVLSVALLGLSSAVCPLLAQPDPNAGQGSAPTQSKAISSSQSTPTNDLTFVLRHIKPSLMVYWLDPVNHPQPSELRIMEKLGGDIFKDLPRLPGNINGPLGLKIPQGVESVTATDAQNTLTAHGTKEGLDALKTLLPTLDVRLVQYEVEALCVQIKREDLPKLGVKLVAPTRGLSQESFGVVTEVPDHFQDRLNALSNIGIGKVMTAPRVTILDGMCTSLTQYTSTRPLGLPDASAHPVVPVPNSYISSGITKDELVKRLGPKTAEGLVMSVGLHVTALHREGGLVTLAIAFTYEDHSVSVQTTVSENHLFAVQLTQPTEEKQIFILVSSGVVSRGK